MKLFPTKIELPDGSEPFTFHIQNTSMDEDASTLILFKVRRSEPKLVEFSPKHGIVEPGHMVDVEGQFINANITLAKLTVKMVCIPRSSLTPDFEASWQTACQSQAGANVIKKIISVKNLAFSVRLKDTLEASMDTSYYRGVGPNNTHAVHVNDDILSEVSDLSESQDRRNRLSRQVRKANDVQVTAADDDLVKSAVKGDVIDSRNDRQEKSSASPASSKHTSHSKMHLNSVGAAGNLDLDAILTQITHSLAGGNGAGQSGEGANIASNSVDTRSSMYIGVGVGLAAAIIPQQLAAAQMPARQPTYSHPSTPLNTSMDSGRQSQTNLPKSGGGSHTVPAGSRPLSPVSSALADVAHKEKHLQNVLNRSTDRGRDEYRGPRRAEYFSDAFAEAKHEHGGHTSTCDADDDDFFVTSIGASPMRSPTTRATNQTQYSTNAPTNVMVIFDRTTDGKPRRKMSAPSGDDDGDPDTETNANFYGEEDDNGDDELTKNGTQSYLLSNSKLARWNDAHICRHHISEEHVYVEAPLDRDYYVEVKGSMITDSMCKEAIELRKLRFDLICLLLSELNFNLFYVYQDVPKESIPANQLTRLSSNLAHR
jgi:hypothetical protein